VLTIVRSNRFLKDLRLAKKRGLDLSSLEEVVNKLANQEKLDEKYHDHPLSNQLNRNYRFDLIELFFFFHAYYKWF